MTMVNILFKTSSWAFILVCVLCSCSREEFKDSTTFDAREWELDSDGLSIPALNALMEGEWSLRYTTLFVSDKSLIKNFNPGEVIWEVDVTSKVIYRDSKTNGTQYQLALEPVDPQNLNARLVPIIFMDGEKGYLSIGADRMVISFGYIDLPNYYFERYD